MSSSNFYHFYLLRKFYRKLWRNFIIVLLVICMIFLMLFEKNRIYSSKINSSDVQTKSISVRHLLSTNESKNFPEDLFTKEQRKSGAVICHIIGMIYMFVALAIVCDEFFIPALDVITEKLDISEDIAGATFMAAGGSAPELFTSIIGVFISNDDVGIGTIVGSAVFNILFVISMCAIFSKSVLELTWWPLFRDVSFYSIILISLMLCFLDNIIFWYEALIMLLWYVGYVTFMKYNETLERVIKRVLNRAKANKTEPINPYVSKMGRKMSTPILHGGSKFRQGVLQLMIHSIDPLHEESINNDSLTNRSESGSHPHIHPPGAIGCTECSEDDATKTANGNNIFHTTKLAVQRSNSTSLHKQNGSLQKEKTIEDEKEEPLNISWPTNLRKQFTYVILAPIIIPLWLTMPDVRRPEKRKWFAGSFIGSIVWIAIYSYLMVWWATLVGETFEIPSEIMGITFLAAGTSIPDLITSVLVARKGFGDMAVSSSVGSNIFDVTVGLPLPWFLHTIIIGSVTVTSKGMICSILLLFIMLLFVILTIALFKWKLNIGMAIVMFILYFVFIACSLILENNVITCSSIVPFF